MASKTEINCFYSTRGQKSNVKVLASLLSGETCLVRLEKAAVLVTSLRLSEHAGQGWEKRGGEGERKRERQGESKRQKSPSRPYP